MYVMLTDESNNEPSTNIKFFVFGGLFFPVEYLKKIHDNISYIRKRESIPPNVELKFSNPKKKINPKIHKRIKNELLDYCVDNKFKFLAYIIHHGIASKCSNPQFKDQVNKRKIEYAANQILCHYNIFLETVARDSGICVFDKLPCINPKQYFQKKFCKGLSYGNSDNTLIVPLNRILLYSSSYINSSHALSLIDIAVGGFRHCVNNLSDNQAAQEIFPKIKKLIYNANKTSKYNLENHGIIIRPRYFDPIFKQDYINVLRNLSQLLKQEKEYGVKTRGCLHTAYLQ